LRVGALGLIVVLAWVGERSCVIRVGRLVGVGRKDAGVMGCGPGDGGMFWLVYELVVVTGVPRECWGEACGTGTSVEL